MSEFETGKKGGRERLKKILLQSVDITSLPEPLKSVVVLPTLGGFIFTIAVIVFAIAMKDRGILTLCFISLFMLFRGPYLVYRWNNGKITVRSFICIGTHRRANGYVVAKCSPMEDVDEKRFGAFNDISITFSKRSARGIAPNTHILVYSDISAQSSALAWEFVE